jgi:hypothetical protein
MSLLEQSELMSRTETPKAKQLAKQFVSVAMKKSNKNPEQLASSLAKNFHKAIMLAIQEELKQQQMKKV